MKRRGVLALILLLSVAFALQAGDVASYVNLGFSVNSQYFLFGYYGIDDASSQPYAELYLVVPGRSTPSLHRISI